MSTIERSAQRPLTITPAGTLANVRPGVDMVSVSETLWRMTRTTGEVLGYIESMGVGPYQQLSARRVLPAGRRVLPLGEFWRLDDAIDCFRI